MGVGRSRPRSRVACGRRRTGLVAGPAPAGRLARVLAGRPSSNPTTRPRSGSRSTRWAALARVRAGGRPSGPARSSRRRQCRAAMCGRRGVWQLVSRNGSLFASWLLGCVRHHLSRCRGAVPAGHAGLRGHGRPRRSRAPCVTPGDRARMHPASGPRGLLELRRRGCRRALHRHHGLARRPQGMRTGARGTRSGGSPSRQRRPDRPSLDPVGRRGLRRDERGRRPSPAPLPAPGAAAPPPSRR